MLGRRGPGEGQKEGVRVHEKGYCDAGSGSGCKEGGRKPRQTRYSPG